METLLVRLKPYDHRRGHVLRRYTYAGIKFQVDRGWSRVEKPVADYLRAVRQIPGDTYSPLAFDVCTEEGSRLWTRHLPRVETAAETAGRVPRGGRAALVCRGG